MSSLTVAQKVQAVRGALSGKVVALFRKMCREVPRTVTIYELPFTPSEVRHLVGLQFRNNMHIKDPRVVEMLLTKV
jgi:NADH dehydrogenase (ubiquinone) 1 alpha subcomplex subunit 6